jgi:uncharacterized membrane protein
MTAPHADQLIDGYLARLRVAAPDLPAGAREELIEDMRAHIAEARAREPQETDATILNILDRLGEPDAVVAEARRRPDPFAPAQPSARALPERPGILEIAALVLIPFLWPVGVILLWLSPAWNVRDKVIGTVVPFGGYPWIIVMLIFAGHALSGIAYGIIGPLLGLIGLALPVVAAAYLAIRLRVAGRANVEGAVAGG